MKSKPQTLQNQIIKETFAKNRMSKALFVQKKIADGRTDRQTDRHRDSINYIGIGLVPFFTFYRVGQKKNKQN